MSPEPSPALGAEAVPAPHGTTGDVARETEMIGSLGEALAGVNLGANTVRHNNGFSFHSEHDSGAPFNLHTPPSNAGADLGGWGFNAEASTQGFTVNGNNGVGAGGEDSMKAPGDPSRNQGIDIFLSQSPSQMLGNHVFQLSNTNRPGLDMPQEERQSDPFRQQPIGQPSPGFGDLRASQDTRQVRKTESPSNLTGTSTSSRSGSPYNTDGGRTIQAYQGYGNPNYLSKDTPSKRTPSFGEEERPPASRMAPGMSPHTMLMNEMPSSPYNLNSTVGIQSHSGFTATYDSGSLHGSPQKQSMSNPVLQQQPQQQQQQQVLYMAVPTPDGRGQVLQPVHMVQLPGKPFAYVLPGQPGAMAGIESPQSMMVLPNIPLQQQPTMTNELNSNIVGGIIRNPGQARNTGYLPSTPESNPYADSQVSGLRGGVDYNSNLNSGSPYSVPGLNPTISEQDPLSSLYNNPQRPPLDALLGQVRRLSRDQVGCRLVQQALDEEGPVAATLILNEGLPFWGEAMVDPFGNYLFQKILEKITPDERIMLVKSVGPRLVNASLNLHGTRSVQKIVELCAMDEESEGGKDGESAAEVLTRSLAPAAARLCIDSHGNHVIQRILLKLSHKHAKFVFDAVAESVSDVARHRHGCCVIQRCLDSAPCPARAHLVCRIVDKSLELMQDAYGNYVVQYVLDVCSDDDVHAVCESVVGKVSLLAIQKFSSNVMEKCLERCTDRVKEQYLNELNDPERIRELMMDPFGNYVVQRALSVATHAQAVRLVEAMRPHLTTTQPGTPNGHRNGGVRNTAGGRRIMAKICRRFPNFNLNGVGTREEIYSQSKAHHRHHHHTSPVPQSYGHVSSPQGQPHMQHQQLHHQPRYNVNPNAVNMNTHPFDQRQPYFDIGDAGYFQHSPHMGNMGNGAYPSGF